MIGPVALVGAGEFTAALRELDAELLAATGRGRPRVAVVPTASFPDGEEAFLRVAARAVDHFAALGAEVEVVLITDRSAASDPEWVQALGEADLIDLAGGDPGHLSRTLLGTPAWESVLSATARGAVLVGCDAGAVALAARRAERRRGHLPCPLRWRAALGVVEGAAVLTRCDRRPDVLAALAALQAPRGIAILGLDEGAAVIGRDGVWQVRGSGRVTVWRGRDRVRHSRGDVFRLQPPAAGR